TGTLQAGIRRNREAHRAIARAATGGDGDPCIGTAGRPITPDRGVHSEETCITGGGKPLIAGSERSDAVVATQKGGNIRIRHTEAPVVVTGGWRRARRLAAPESTDQLRVG